MSKQANKNAPASALTLRGRGRTDKEFDVNSIPAPILRLPLDRSDRAHCGQRSRSGKCCNRRPEHTGRHAFYWRHLDGKVREVWA